GVLADRGFARLGLRHPGAGALRLLDEGAPCGAVLLSGLDHALPDALFEVLLRGHLDSVFRDKRWLWPRQSAGSTATRARAISAGRCVARNLTISSRTRHCRNQRRSASAAVIDARNC